MRKPSIIFLNLGTLLVALLHLGFSYVTPSSGSLNQLIEADARPVQTIPVVASASAASSESELAAFAASTVPASASSRRYNFVPQESGAAVVSVSAEPDETSYAESLDTLGITLHPGSDYAPNGDGTPDDLDSCKSLVYRTLKSLPNAPVRKLKNLTLYFNENGRRGLGGGDTIILRCQNVDDEELVGVLVHEMGHIMDTGVLKGVAGSLPSEFKDGSAIIYENDPSVEFYRLSFEDTKTLRDDVTEYGFVSQYAMTDPFEDFAETYAYYVLHGTEFRQLMQDNVVLNQKYQFMKTNVFDGKEYFNGEENVDTGVRHYDVTVLPFDLQRFFVI